MLEKRIKRYMDDIIDNAFKDAPDKKIKAYKAFWLNFTQKEVRSYGGRYHYRTHTIELTNASHGPRHLAKTCLHELAHHIDCIDNGVSGHQKPFYERYAKLIYASLDMGILEKADFEHDTWSSDQNKVRSIVSTYIPRPIEYKIDDLQIICVKNGYDKRTELKEAGYKWNKLEQLWEKETDDTEEEEKRLQEIGIRPESETTETSISYYIKDHSMHVEAIVYLKAEGNTYAKRDVLKEYGFYFKKDQKAWLCKVSASNKDLLVAKLKKDNALVDCTFSLVSKNNQAKKPPRPHKKRS